MIDFTGLAIALGAALQGLISGIQFLITAYIRFVASRRTRLSKASAIVLPGAIIAAGVIFLIY